MKEEKSFVFLDNCLDLIRLFAALQVAVSHYLNLTLLHYGQTRPEDSLLLWFKRGITLFPGVVILFTISGFLMGAALQKESRRKVFLKKRFRRVYPALWVNLVLTAAFICVIVKPAPGQLRSLLVWGGIQFIGIAYTPGFLKEFGAGSINGALWTIMVEIQFYLLLFLLWNYLKKRSDRWWHSACAAAFACNLICWLVTDRQLAGPAFCALLDRSFLPYLCWFLLGMELYRMKERVVPLLTGWLPVLAVIYVVYKACWQHFSWSVPGYYADFVTSLFLPFLVIGCAYGFGKCRLKQDLSYGIFLYHWPLINLVFHFDLPERMNHILLFAGYLIAFVSLAAASWYFVERRVVKRRI